MSKVKIVTFVPSEHADAVREALGRAGAGRIGAYSYCSFSIKGTGRFTPSKGATPHIGEKGKNNSVLEERIEVECDRSVAKNVISAIRAVHPYEEVALDIYPLIDEVEL